jgi:fatty acid desaturase
MPHHVIIYTMKDYGEFRDHTIAAGALLTICVLIFQSYLSQSPNRIDIYQTISLICFAISIPGLAFWYYISKNSDTLKINKNNMNNIMVFFALSAISALIGIAAIIWRYHYVAAILFLVAAITAVVFFAIVDNDTHNKK